MKSAVILFLSLLLTMAVIAPSVITLITLDNDTAALFDFNEEENKKEEKKEINENDFFLYSWPTTLTASTYKTSYFKGVYLEFNYTNTLEIFLPPPKHIS